MNILFINEIPICVFVSSLNRLHRKYETCVILHHILLIFLKFKVFFQADKYRCTNLSLKCKRFCRFIFFMIHYALKCYID